MPLVTSNGDSGVNMGINVNQSCRLSSSSLESWTVYRRSVHLRDQFHLLCLRRIAGVKWQDRVPNTDVLRTCQMPGIEALLL